MNKQEEQDEDDITLLDIFAGLALTGCIKYAYAFDDSADIAKRAYDIAEAIIKERSTRKTIKDVSKN
jgi:hypothetical protein